MVGAFVDFALSEKYQSLRWGDSAARIDESIDCLSTGGGWFHWLVGRGVVSHTESFKVAQFCLYHHTMPPDYRHTTTQRREVVGEQVASFTSFRLLSTFCIYEEGEGLLHMQ